MNIHLKIAFAIILFFSSFLPEARTQCSTYIQMVPGVECVLPEVVSTQELLLPCSSPPGFSQLEAGDFAYIEYADTSCITFCQQGHEVIITCFSLPVATENPEADDSIKVFPTLVQSSITVDGKNIDRIEVYNNCGAQLILLNSFHDSVINLEDLPPGVYFLRLYTSSKIQISKIIKL